MFDKIKELLCFHKFSLTHQFYTIERRIDYSSFYNEFVYVIRLYTHSRCEKCRKEKIKRELKFVCFPEEKDTIINLIENHGAVFYSKYLQKQIEGK